MGLSYSFRFYLPKTNVEKALLSLVMLGDEESYGYLIGAVPYVPAAEFIFLSNQSKFSRLSLGVKGLELGKSPFVDNCYCLSLLFPTDYETLKVAVQPTGFAKDKVRVGCIYLSVAVGENFAEISLMAATSDISRMFENSTLSQQEMVTLQKQMGALVCLLDMEIADLVVLGEGKKMVVFDSDDYYIHEDLMQESPKRFYPREDIDAKTREILKQCAIEIE